MCTKQFIGWLTYFAICMLVAVKTGTAQAPTHTGKFAPVLNENINGFYEYLPRNYAADINTRYPLLVFFHAAGESGTGNSQSVLDKVTTWGVPKLIKAGVFPDSFNVGGKWRKYIVISPQVKKGLNWTVVDNPDIAPAVDAVIEYAKSAYRVDPSKIYLCGMSMGGSIALSYAGSSFSAASKLAGIVVACGAGDLSAAGANTIAASNLPVLATHNRGDMTVSYTKTINNAALINAYTPRINPPPKLVIWQDGDHNVWSRTYEDINPGQTSQGLHGNLRDSLGLSIYEWMLQFSRAGVVLPVHWQHFSVTEVNGVARLNWTVNQAVNTLSYTVESSSNGNNDWQALSIIAARDSVGIEQRYQFTDRVNAARYYRIRLTDRDGTFSFSSTLYFVPSQQTAGIKLFPNPFQDKLVIQSTAFTQQSVSVQLLTAFGQLMLKQQYPTGNNNEIIIDNLGKLPRGVYYAVIENADGNNISRMRIIKEQ